MSISHSASLSSVPRSGVVLNAVSAIDKDCLIGFPGASHLKQQANQRLVTLLLMKGDPNAQSLTYFHLSKKSTLAQTDKIFFLMGLEKVSHGFNVKRTSTKNGVPLIPAEKDLTPSQIPTLKD